MNSGAQRASGRAQMKLRRMLLQLEIPFKQAVGMARSGRWCSNVLCQQVYWGRVVP